MHSSSVFREQYTYDEYTPSTGWVKHSFTARPCSKTCNSGGIEGGVPPSHAKQGRGQRPLRSRASQNIRDNCAPVGVFLYFLKVATDALHPSSILHLIGRYVRCYDSDAISRILHVVREYASLRWLTQLYALALFRVEFRLYRVRNSDDMHTEETRYVGLINI